MPSQKSHYILTETAARDFRQVRQWSLSRWGKSLTKQYFTSIHNSAEKLGQHQGSFGEISGLIDEVNTKLKVYPIREHYLVYMPLDKELIAIVALIRQTRDVPAIIEANSFKISRELKVIYQQLKFATKQ